MHTYYGVRKFQRWSSITDVKLQRVHIRHCSDFRFNKLLSDAKARLALVLILQKTI